MEKNILINFKGNKGDKITIISGGATITGRLSNGKGSFILSTKDELIKFDLPKTSKIVSMIWK